MQASIEKSQWFSNIPVDFILPYLVPAKYTTRNQHSARVDPLRGKYPLAHNVHVCSANVFGRSL